MASSNPQQLRQIISDENSKLRQELKSDLSKVNQELKSDLSKLNKKTDKNHHEIKIWFNDLDKRVFHVDQRLSQIEYHLGLPTPRFDPDKPIESVFINPIHK